ncbi:MAG TPA: saccharopine dehydrogenase C-terminal domain-containing protein [Chitinophagales bacterium]|nr:saccharopine dehydrogenase C-terminal domain-containing protein [Chitinophagales bacterium]
MNQIIILGAGMVGRAMAIDLAKNHAVTSADLSKKNLELLPSNIKKIEADLSDQNKIREIIDDADLVIGAVPGFMGFETVETVITAGKNIVDISFFPENAFDLDALAQAKNVIAIVDCGVAPGMFNIILGYHNERMQVENFVAMCGGLPVKRTMPFQYKAPFSPVDVIEIYTRPAQIMVNGKLITVPALSDIEEIDFDEVGTLEAFNTDGLRSLVHTMKIPNMKEKTLRYPGHTKLMEQLREMGLFSEEEIDVKGKKIRPVDVTASLLFPQWKYEPGEGEFTVMRLIIEGIEKGKPKRYQYDLFDRYHQPTKTSSMERSTGYTCTAVANMVIDGLYSQKGISPPEFLGREEKCFEYIINYLQERHVIYNKKED